MRRMDGKTIGRRLRECRGVFRTQAEVASETGLSCAAISAYENGSRIPADPVKIKLADFYGTSVGFLFYGEECHTS